MLASRTSFLSCRVWFARYHLADIGPVLVEDFGVRGLGFRCRVSGLGLWLQMQGVGVSGVACVPDLADVDLGFAKGATRYAPLTSYIDVCTEKDPSHSQNLALTGLFVRSTGLFVC